MLLRFVLTDSLSPTPDTEGIPGYEGSVSGALGTISSLSLAVQVAASVPSFVAVSLQSSRTTSLHLSLCYLHITSWGGAGTKSSLAPVTKTVPVMACRLILQAEAPNDRLPTVRQAGRSLEAGFEL